MGKLISLFIKTLAKPVAKQVKHQFVKQPITRSSLIWVGQTSNAVTTRMTIWSSGYKVRSISKLEEDKALSLGADILSESFLFAVSGGILVYEYNRSSEKEKKKEAARLQKIRDEATRLQAKLGSLDKRLVALEEYAKANRRSILGIGIGATGEYHEPEEVVPINDAEGDGNVATLNTIGTNRSSTEKTTNQDDSPSTNNNSSTSQRSRRWFWPF
ncbi:hypothetical protein ACHAXR_001069 [Thalassiosira sp. AJA248-18]